MDAILEPLTLGFMQRGLMIGLLLAAACGMLGTFVVLRGMEYIGDAISHSILPGVVLALLLNASLLVGGIAAGLVAAGLIAFIGRGGRVSESSTIGVVFTGALSLGVVIISATRSYSRDLGHILFGNILAVTTTDLAFAGGVTLLVVILIGALKKELALASFDPTHARKIGIPVEGLRAGLLAMLTLCIVAGASSVGALMVSALLITPAAAARLLSRRLNSMMLLSAGIASASVLAGLFGAYYLDIAPGATIVLVCTLFFVLAMAAGNRGRRLG